MPTHYGKNLDIEIYGGSHDEKIGVIIKGLPVGFRIDYEELLRFMKRRAPGQDSLSTPRKEADTPVFLRGVSENNVITSDTVEAVIYNSNQKSEHYKSLSSVPRPSHADYAAMMKYGDDVDLRGGGHFSGRLTACMCIAGGISLQILKEKGIFIGAHIYSVGDILDTPYNSINLSEKELSIASGNSFPTIDSAAADKMQALISDVRSLGDSIGGSIECTAIGLPAGLGEHIFDGVEGRISSIMFGIPGVKGIEFGNGFECTKLRGSQNNDAFYTDGKAVYTKTNNCGGILGGMTNGMPLVFRIAIKPTPSIFIEQDSVDMNTMTNVKLNIKGRHDPCIVRRAVPVVEAACAIALLDIIKDNL